MGPRLSAIKKKKPKERNGTSLPVPLQLTTPTDATLQNGDPPNDGENAYDQEPDDQQPAPQDDMVQHIPEDQRSIVVALHANWGKAELELSFEKGARFEVIDQTYGDWWYVRHLSSNEQGYIAANLVVDATALEAQDWYFGLINRNEAEKYLTRDPSYPVGTFLVRASGSSSTHSHALSIKGPGVSGNIVRHHRLLMDPSGYVYIVSGCPFRTMQDLVNYYSQNKNSVMAPLLSVPCPKPLPTQWDLSMQTRDKWEINRNSLHRTRKLGAGNFGDVWHGLWNNTRDVAIKTLKPGTMTADAFLAEATIMKKLRHPNILILYAVCTDEEPILIVTEYMNKGALLDVLRKEGDKMKFPELIEICAQVASGMAYLEEGLFIHRDLAARNVLVDTNKFCKVADFGLARIAEDGEYSPETSKNFPVKWTAPEAIMFNTYTIKSDVWSFGILIMEVITRGAIPYPGMSNQDVIHMVQSGYRIPRPVPPIECPDFLYNEIIMRCWNKIAEDRPTFETLSAQLSDYVVASDISYDEPGME